MTKLRAIRLTLLAVGLSLASAAQESPQPQPPTTPAPAFGQNVPVLDPENPPVTGLDEPSLDLRTSSRSFIAPALQVSESADTNGGNQLGSSGVQSVSHVLGALDLEQFWPKSDLFLEYLGGGAFYADPYNVKQLQAFGLEAITRWRTGQVTVRDSFSYLPDGSFVMGFGGVPGLGLANGGFGLGMQGGGVPGLNSPNSQLGSVGTIPRLANSAILDAVQAISPVSAITVAGGFSNAHFFDPTDLLINSDEVTVEAGYSHLINHHDQIGVVYAFQLFQFPQFTGGEIYNNIVNLRYSHTISGRLSLIVGAGPQHTELEQGGSYSHWSLSARAQLRYKFGHSALLASYEKFTSAGSGFFAGANVQAVRVGYSRPLGRTWTFYGDLGYSHNAELQTVPGQVSASSFDNGSAGFNLRKHLGRTYDFFASYRFGEEAFNSEITFEGSSGRISQRQIGTVGLEWHPKRTRIE
jgi:hypothetical protein